MLFVSVCILSSIDIFDNYTKRLCVTRLKLPLSLHYPLLLRSIVICSLLAKNSCMKFLLWKLHRTHSDGVSIISINSALLYVCIRLFMCSKSLKVSSETPAESQPTWNYLWYFDSWARSRLRWRKIIFWIRACWQISSVFHVSIVLNISMKTYNARHCNLMIKYEK